MTPPSTPPAPAPGTTWTPTREQKAECLHRALDGYRRRDGTMRLCKDYPTNTCGRDDCLGVGCARVRALMQGRAVLDADPRDAEIERLRAALREIAERSCDSSEGEFRCSIMDSVTDIAREALAR